MRASDLIKEIIRLTDGDKKAEAAAVVLEALTDNLDGDIFVELNETDHEVGHVHYDYKGSLCIVIDDGEE